MPTDPRLLTYKLLDELGVKNADPALAEQVEDHFTKVVFEVLLRRAPENNLSEIRVKMESDDPDLENFIAELSAGMPGLAQDIEEAVAREYEAISNMLNK